MMLYKNKMNQILKNKWYYYVPLWIAIVVFITLLIFKLSKDMTGGYVPLFLLPLIIIYFLSNKKRLLEGYGHEDLSKQDIKSSRIIFGIMALMGVIALVVPLILGITNRFLLIIGICATILGVMYFVRPTHLEILEKNQTVEQQSKKRRKVVIRFAIMFAVILMMIIFLVFVKLKSG